MQTATKRRFSRRAFLSAPAAVGLSGVSRADSRSGPKEKTQPNLSASHPARMLADKFVEWQNPYGRLDPGRCPVASISFRKLSGSFG